MTHSIKALISGAFFVFTFARFFLFPVPVFALAAAYPKVSCGLSGQGLADLEIVRVRWVYDADTLLLEDGRKIRLIGVDAPEVRHHDEPGELFGAQATEALRERLKRFDYQVYLEFGPDRLDRYRRTLAHVYFADGKSMALWVLSGGYARTLALPPNVSKAACYAEAERSARDNKLNIWSLASFQLQQAATLPADFHGFAWISGLVVAVRDRRRSVSLELLSDSKRPIVVVIQKRNSHYFKTLDLAKLVKRTIRVQGKLRLQKKRRVLYLDHPSQMEIEARQTLDDR